MPTDQEIVIQANGAELSGTLCLPKQSGAFPVVLMVHGSGALDRNENAKRFKLDIFNTLAKHLVRAGVASFRYDKRGIGKSGGNYYSAGHFDLLEDAQACLEKLNQHEQCNSHKLFVLGHSEGTLIATEMASNNPLIAGLVLLAPFVDTIESILLKQAQQLKHNAQALSGIPHWPVKLLFQLYEPVRTQQNLIRKIKQATKPTIYFMLKKIPAKWLGELLSIDPASVYPHIDCPCLIIGGSKDVQCDPEDVAIIANLVPGDVEAHVIENLSHLLRIETGSASFFSYYIQTKQPVDTKVLRLIVGWCQTKGRHP